MTARRCEATQQELHFTNNNQFFAVSRKCDISCLKYFKNIVCLELIMFFHTFSAFWLRSSVVSVLLSLISETGSTRPFLLIRTISANRSRSARDAQACLCCATRRTWPWPRTSARFSRGFYIPIKIRVRKPTDASVLCALSCLAQ